MTTRPTTWLPLLLAAAILLSGASESAAAPPANDDFQKAVPLVLGETRADTNLEATFQAGETQPAANGVVIDSNCTGPSCSTSTWYTFQPAANGDYRIETCDLGTDLDTVVAVYTGSALGSLTEVTSNNTGPTCAGGNGNEGSQVDFTGTGGTTYRVAVWGTYISSGSYYLRVHQAASPPAGLNAPDTQIPRTGSVAGRLHSIPNNLSSGPRATPSFSFASPAAGARFECSLDGAGFAACASPVSYDIGDSGLHTFQVRAVDGGSTDSSPAVQRFVVDRTPPETTITEEPTGDHPRVSAISSELHAWQKYACGLDGQYTSFGCERTVHFWPLCAGPHTISIAAIDRAENVDPTPETRRVDVPASLAVPCEPPAISKHPAADDLTPTSAIVHLDTDPKNAGAQIRIDYGTTTAYGLSRTYWLKGDFSPGYTSYELHYLTPGTTYHYKATLTTPFGQAQTGDLTFTTKPPAAQALPVPVAGEAQLIGHHAARIPITVDAKGSDGGHILFVSDSGPAGAYSAAFPGTVPNSPSINGPQAHSYELLDLKPGKTYHYRAGAWNLGGDAISADRSFTVPGTATPVPTTTPHDPSKPRPNAKPPSRPIALVARLTAFSLSAPTFRAKPRGATISARRAPLGTTVRFRANTRGTVRFTVERRTTGRRVGTRCLAATRARAKRRRCVRFVAVRPSFGRVARTLGNQSFRFSGRIGGRALKAGAYRLAAAVVVKKGERTLTRRTAFTIVK